MADFRIAIRGKVPGDIYQFGFVLQSDEGIDALTTRVASQMTAYLTTTIRGHFPAGVTFDSVYVSELATGSGAVLNTDEAPIGLAGTSATAPLPPQIALAVGVLPVTGTTRGRFYLPPLASNNLSNTGRLSPTTQTQQADAWQGFFAALGSAGAPARLGIWRTGSNSFAASKGIQIGDVFDTQRRRRNKLIESRIDRIVL